MTATVTITKGYADTQEGQLHYRTCPSGDPSAAPILFFHRAPVCSGSFDQVLKRLSGWRRMVAFDTPGFGQSYTPDAGTPISRVVDAFVQAVEGLGINRFHLVAHHSGSHFASELALRLPGRALSLMLDGAMVASAEERAKVTPAATLPTIDPQGGYIEAAWKFLLPYYTVFDERCIHNEFVGAMASTFTRAATMDMVRAHDLGGVIAGLDCPILASAAVDDVFVAHLDRIAALASQSIIRRYGAAGIASPALQTEVFCDLVRESVGRAEG
ncbi:MULTISPECIES: alpha/beta fold hydrolase [unclassified Azospirillum]|uniref:alpha/beta fold hydrolase n=1 Tax=unclassified Azospirillum TaxID=2630922 RepID=UPI001177BF24|nr:MULTISPECIES: alpha/beta hydrolase [unclassified Azospirillum]